MRRMMRSDRKTAIFNALNGMEIAVTAGELAARMGLTASPYFREIVNELVAEGWFFRSTKLMPNGVTAYIYSTFEPGKPPVHE